MLVSVGRTCWRWEIILGDPSSAVGNRTEETNVKEIWERDHRIKYSHSFSSQGSHDNYLNQAMLTLQLQVTFHRRNGLNSSWLFIGSCKSSNFRLPVNISYISTTLNIVTSAINWTFVPPFPPPFICWTLIPKVMVLGGRAFRRWLGHKDRALINGISAFIKSNPENFLAPPTMRGHSGNSSVYESGSELSPDTESSGILILNFSASRTARNKCLLIRSPWLW